MRTSKAIFFRRFVNNVNKDLGPHCYKNLKKILLQNSEGHKSLNLRDLKIKVEPHTHNYMYYKYNTMFAFLFYLLKIGLCKNIILAMTAGENTVEHC